jgi:acetylornithine deacetylase/succinyl-diaminopimelate desuccinylase-like protein
MVWMKDRLRQGGPYPAINLLLIGNEENGESEPMGTPHVLRHVAEEWFSPDGKAYEPQLLIAGERTGEKGDELWGEVCPQNRGIMRFDVLARGTRGHTGVSQSAPTAPFSETSTKKAAPLPALSGDLAERLWIARDGIDQIAKRHLTLKDKAGWQSQVRYPFIQAGTPGIYNVSADFAVMGVEIRPIPQDNLEGFRIDLADYCQQMALELIVRVMENGVACDPDNPYLIKLLSAIRQKSGSSPNQGKKLPATSARFAPRAQGIVWGQSGIGPHAKDERHYIPSIQPYYDALDAYGNLLLEQG